VNTLALQALLDVSTGREKGKRKEPVLVQGPYEIKKTDFTTAQEKVVIKYEGYFQS
jgi:hypothetical protein